MQRATTFDIYVMDLSAKWNKKQHEDQDKAKDDPAQEVKSGHPVKSKLTQEQMAELLRRAKESK